MHTIASSAHSSKIRGRSVLDRPSDSTHVVVTGASGLIGSAVTRALVHAGYRVRVLLEPGRGNEHLDDLAIERVVGDIRDPLASLGASDRHV